MKRITSLLAAVLVVPCLAWSDAGSSQATQEALSAAGILRLADVTAPKVPLAEVQAPADARAGTPVAMIRRMFDSADDPISKEDVEGWRSGVIAFSIDAWLAYPSLLAGGEMPQSAEAEAAKAYKLSSVHSNEPPTRFRPIDLQRYEHLTQSEAAQVKAGLERNAANYTEPVFSGTQVDWKTKSGSASFTLKKKGDYLLLRFDQGTRTAAFGLYRNKIAAR